MSLLGKPGASANNLVEADLQAREVIPRDLLIELVRLVDEGGKT